MQLGNSSPDTARESVHPRRGVSWQVRPFRESDLPGLLELYRLVFGRERVEAEFRWKLQGRQSPVDTVWVAADGDTIVGQHAGIPMHVKLGDRIVFGMHAVEAMTHPDYRKQGMLTVLGGALYNHWRERGVPFIMGLPHAGWGTRAHALGYREAFPLRWLSRPIRPISMILAKFGRSASNASKTTTTLSVGWPLRSNGLEIAPFDRTVDLEAIWTHAGSAFHTTVVRDASWVHWRYLEAPGTLYSVLIATRHGRPVGYVAYSLVSISGRLIGRIADLFARTDEKEAASGLLKGALHDLRARGADSTTVLVGVDTSLFPAVRASGFLLNRGDFEVSFIPLSEEVGLESLSNPTRWHLMGGDFDVI